MICHWWISICFLCFCVSRFVACDRNYDWRQRKTQLWKRLLNLRVRMFVKGAVKNWMSKNNRRGREFMFPVTFQRRRRCWFVNSLKFYHFYAYLWSIGSCNRQCFGSRAGSTILKVLNKISDHSTPPTDHPTGLCERQSCKQESTIQISRWATLENGCYVLIMKFEYLMCLSSHYFQSSPWGV